MPVPNKISPKQNNNVHLQRGEYNEPKKKKYLKVNSMLVAFTYTTCCCYNN